MKNFTIFLVVILSVPGCADSKKAIMLRFGGTTQGTYYMITYFDEEGVNYQRQIDSVFSLVNRSVSLWDSGSILSRMNRNDTSVRADLILQDLFLLSKEVWKKTDGAFDPTVGPLVQAWGFSFSDRQKLDSSSVDSLLTHVDFGKVSMQDGRIIKTDPQIRLDFNAIAQGYTVDLVAKFLDSKGIRSYLVDIGGEIAAKGQKPAGERWTVGIEKPSADSVSERQLKTAVYLINKAMSTSGSYRKYFIENGARYSHTIDPADGNPVHHSLLSVSVVADDCATADAFATAFMVMGAEKAKEFIAGFPKLDACFIFQDKNGQLQTHYTDGLSRIIKEEY